MPLTHPSWTVDTTFSAKDISSAASVYTFTAAAAAKVQFTIKLTNAAGNGDYIVYLQHQWLGTGTASVVLPKATCAAASGETVIEFVSMELSVKATDVVDVYIDGLAGDTSVSGAIRISADNPSVFDVANDVPAVNVTYSAGVELGGRLAEAADLPAEPLDAAGVRTAVVLASANLDTQLGDLPTVAEFEARTLPAADYTVVGDLPSVPTADQNADAVWDEATAGHATSGTTGAALAAAGAASDPWATPLPGSYDAGSAGALFGVLAEIDVSAVTVATANAAGDLAIKRTVTFEETVSGLTIPGDWSVMLWTLKSSKAADDADALAQLRVSNPADAEGDGLQVLAGASATASDGALTVNQGAGTATIRLEDQATAAISAKNGLYWDLKCIDANGDTSEITAGTASVVHVVTHAMS